LARAYQSLIEWTRGKAETNGFKLLVDAGMPENTAEYLVAEFADKFPEDVVELARDRLRAREILLPAA
jgi:hypothetical protein